MESHLLSLNEFNRPKVLGEGNAAYMHIIHLILCTPGRYPSHPTMGVGLRERYRDNNNENFLTQLQQEIKEQISQFLPELTQVEVSLSIVKGNILRIVINTAEGAYAVSYDSITETMKPATSYVLDEL